MKLKISIDSNSTPLDRVRNTQENGVDFRDIFGDGVRDRVDGRVAAYDEVPEH